MFIRTNSSVSYATCMPDGDTILRWHRELVARKWTYRPGRKRPVGHQAHLRALIIRMATDNPTWGYTRIQGALKNLGHRVGRSTIARIPARGRHSAQPAAPHDVENVSSSTLAGPRGGGVLHHRSLDHPRISDVLRGIPAGPAVAADSADRMHAVSERSIRHRVLAPRHRRPGLLSESRPLHCDRDPKWSGAVEQWLGTTGVRVVRTPPRTPNCNAYAERFVRSGKEERLDRIVPLGERHLRRTLQEFAAHYHRERNHQGLGNELIDRPTAHRPIGPVRRRHRVGGILSYYYRSAA